MIREQCEPAEPDLNPAAFVWICQLLTQRLHYNGTIEFVELALCNRPQTSDVLPDPPQLTSYLMKLISGIFSAAQTEPPDRKQTS